MKNFKKNIIFLLITLFGIQNFQPILGMDIKGKIVESSVKVLNSNKTILILSPVYLLYLYQIFNEAARFAHGFKSLTFDEYFAKFKKTYFEQQVLIKKLNLPDELIEKISNNLKLNKKVAEAIAWKSYQKSNNIFGQTLIGQIFDKIDHTIYHISHRISPGSMELLDRIILLPIIFRLVKFYHDKKF